MPIEMFGIQQNSALCIVRFDIALEWNCHRLEEDNLVKLSLSLVLKELNKILIVHQTLLNWV